MVFRSNRCRIPECEPSNVTVHDPDWLNYAIPFRNGRPEKCSRYAASHASIAYRSEYCTPSLFNQSEIIRCNEYVFKTNEYRIMKEVRRPFVRLNQLIYQCDFSLAFCAMKMSTNWRS